MTIARIAIARICRMLQPAIAAGLLVILATFSFAGSSRAQDTATSTASTGGGAEVPETGTFERENLLKAAFVVNFAALHHLAANGGGQRIPRLHRRSWCGG